MLKKVEIEVISTGVWYPIVGWEKLFYWFHDVVGPFLDLFLLHRSILF